MSNNQMQERIQAHNRYLESKRKSKQLVISSKSGMSLTEIRRYALSRGYKMEEVYIH